jgi:hypothetical protein
MFLDGVIGRRGTSIPLPPFGLAKNHYRECYKIACVENKNGIRC